MKESRCSSYMLKQRKNVSWTELNNMRLIGISNISLHNYNSANTCILKSSTARIIMYQHDTRMLGRKQFYSMLKTKNVLKKKNAVARHYYMITVQQNKPRLPWHYSNDLLSFWHKPHLLPISLSSKTFLLAVFLSSKTLFHEATWDIWIFVFEIYKQ